LIWKHFRFANILRIPRLKMRRSDSWPAILPFIVALAIGVVAVNRGQAAEGNTFIIAATDGYGVEVCLAEGGECGHVVADAWCEAHGHGAAISFGLAEDVTGAIAGGGKAGAPYLVTCSD
jgi:hypothetical protein